ncbi:hypothetical protein M758_UG042600, partial [Ceratodon purpureus]
SWPLLAKDHSQPKWLHFRSCRYQKLKPNPPGPQPNPYARGQAACSVAPPSATASWWHSTQLWPPTLKIIPKTKTKIITPHQIPKTLNPKTHQNNFTQSLNLNHIPHITKSKFFFSLLISPILKILISKTEILISIQTLIQLQTLTKLPISAPWS